MQCFFFFLCVLPFLLLHRIRRRGLIQYTDIKIHLFFSSWDILHQRNEPKEKVLINLCLPERSHDTRSYLLFFFFFFIERWVGSDPDHPAGSGTWKHMRYVTNSPPTFHADKQKRVQIGGGRWSGSRSCCRSAPCGCGHGDCWCRKWGGEPGRALRGWIGKLEGLRASRQQVLCHPIPGSYHMGIALFYLVPQAFVKGKLTAN